MIKPPRTLPHRAHVYRLFERFLALQDNAAVVVEFRAVRFNLQRPLEAGPGFKESLLSEKIQSRTVEVLNVFILCR